MLYIIIPIIILIIISLVLFESKNIKDEDEDDDIEKSIKQAEEKEKMLLQPIVTSNDTPKIISNGDGSFYSDKQIVGKSYGLLALTDDESGWHDTGLINGHGQPLVQNDKGEILSVCRGYPCNFVCGVRPNDEIKNWSIL